MPPFAGGLVGVGDDGELGVDVGFVDSVGLVGEGGNVGLGDGGGSGGVDPPHHCSPSGFW